MKKFSVIGIITFALLLPFLSACQPEAEKSRTPIPAGNYEVNTMGFQAADDLFGTPGGIAYAANVIGSSEPNPWPPIKTTLSTLGSGSDTITVQYRADTETKAGETRNNIITVNKDGGLFNNKLVLYSNTKPDGIDLTYSSGSGLPGSLQAILMIKVLTQVSPGNYMFRIIIEIDGKEYGSVLCRINVIE